MTESTVSNQRPQLTMSWVQVVDESGRTRLEARWHVPSQVESSANTTHAA